MKLHSRALDRDFEFVTFEKEVEHGRVIKVIMHDSLRDVILNQTEGDVSYLNTVISADPAHSVVMCEMFKNDGTRRVIEYGESIPETLTSEIARNYPTLTASQRAFDRAAIAFLDLPGKVLSNMELDIIDDVLSADEITSITEQTKQEKKEKETTSGIVSAVVEDDEDGLMDVSVVEEVSPDEDEEVSIDASDTDESNGDFFDAEAEMEESEESEETEDIGNYVVTMNGKYATAGLTISEIHAQNPQWVVWVAKNFVPHNPVAVKDTEQIKRYVTEVLGIDITKADERK